MNKETFQSDLFMGDARKNNRSKGLVTAIDLGSDKIACFIARIDQVTRERRAARIIGAGYCQSKGIKNGLIIDPAEAEKSVRLALDNAENEASVEVSSAYISISGSHIKSSILSGRIPVSERVVNQDHVDAVIKNARKNLNIGDKRVLHVIPSKFLVDGARNVPDPTGLIADILGIELTLITSSNNPTMNIENVIHNCHIDILDILAEPYVSGLACLYEHEKDLGSVCIDIGSGTTSISIFFEGTVVYTKSIKIGGWYISNDIAKGLSTPFEHAEGIKNLYGSALFGSNDMEQFYEIPQLEEKSSSRRSFKLSDLITIIKPRYEEILEMSLHAIENSGYSEIAKRNVVLTGGTTHLTGSLEIAERVLDCSVRLGMPTKLGGLSENTSGPGFSSCAGVIIHSLDQKKIELKAMRKRSSFTQKIIKNLMGTGF